MFGRCVHCSSISRIWENLGLHPIHLSTGHSKRPRRAAGFSARPLEPAGHFSIGLAGGSSMVMSPLFFRVIFPIFRTNLHCVLGFPPKSPWRRQQLCQLHATESITGLVTGHMRGERFVFEALPCGDFCESILLCQTAQAALVNKSIMSLKDSTWKVSAEVLRCQQQDLTWKWQTKSSIINIILSIRVDKI